MKDEKNELWAERADQKHINNLPLARQFALTAVKLQMFGGKTCHVWHPIRTCFFVSCSHLDATDGNMVANATNIFSLATKNSGLVTTLATRFLFDLDLK